MATASAASATASTVATNRAARSGSSRPHAATAAGPATLESLGWRVASAASVRIAFRAAASGS